MVVVFDPRLNKYTKFATNDDFEVDDFANAIEDPNMKFK